MAGRGGPWRKKLGRTEGDGHAGHSGSLGRADGCSDTSATREQRLQKTLLAINWIGREATGNKTSWYYVAVQ